MDLLDKGFVEFFANTPDDKILKAEYLLPIYIDQLLKRSAVSVKVLKTDDKMCIRDRFRAAPPALRK